VTVGAELEALHCEAVENLAVLEPSGVRVVDEFLALGHGGFLTRLQIRDSRPEPIDQLYGMDPQPAHFSWRVAAEIREVPILGSYQVTPVTRRGVRITQILSPIADARHDGGRVILLRQEQMWGG
jgi:hypothetical protein